MYYFTSRWQRGPLPPGRRAGADPWKIFGRASCAGFAGAQSRYHGLQIVEQSLGLPKSRLFVALRPLRVWALHLSAGSTQVGNCGCSRDQRHFFPQNPHIPMLVTAPVMESPPARFEAGTTRSRCGVRDARIRGHVCTCLSRYRVRDSCTHRCLRVSSYYKNSGDNSLPNSDSADLETETGTHRANCSEARGDSTVAKLGQVYLTCPLLCNDRCPWS